jgi:hypothetical protein
VKLLLGHSLGANLVKPNYKQIKPNFKIVLMAGNARPLEVLMGNNMIISIN